MMAGIRGADTKPERMVRSALFAKGFRYRKNCKDLPGKPDIKLTKYRAVILVHGCFWHGHDCRYYRVPGSNAEFWTGKIGHNRERDARDIIALTHSGWRVCVIWECATRMSAKRNAFNSVICHLTEWIRGTVPFIEFYDPVAMVAETAGVRSGAWETGINSDIEVFVAERTSPYAAGRPD
jgi:DNA mismatch endonuclease (patch repair protein)